MRSRTGRCYLFRMTPDKIGAILYLDHMRVLKKGYK
jgi:hypothetical protein